MLRLRPAKYLFHVPGGIAVLHGERSDERRCSGKPLPFYIVGCILCVGLILLTTYFQYNATYFATYTESGVRRITLAERLRKIPCPSSERKTLRIYQHHYGGLHLFRAELFPLYPGACRIHHLYGLDCRQPVLLRLAYGAGGSLGDAGGVCNCRFFCKGTGRFQSEVHGCENGPAQTEFRSVLKRCRI